MSLRPELRPRGSSTCLSQRPRVEDRFSWVPMINFIFLGSKNEMRFIIISLLMIIDVVNRVCTV